MTPDTIFSLCNAVALFSWVALAIFPYQKAVHRILAGIVVASLCVLYTYIILKSIGEPGGSGSFSSLEGVMQLFTRKEAVLAGWIHYLAFDLFVGRWIYLDSRARDLTAWVVAPVLFLTLVLGPCGFLLYLIVCHTRGYLRGGENVIPVSAGAK